MGGDGRGPPPGARRGTEDAGQVRAMGIERAHRSGGAPNADRPRTIVVKFATFKSRDAVLQAARATKPRGVYVNEDFSSRVMSRRK